MKLWRRREPAPSRNGEVAVPAGEPIAYVVVDAGGLYLTQIVADRSTALHVMQRLDDMGAVVFAGEAQRPELAHWQAREALRIYAGGGIGPPPWTGYPRRKGGGAMNVVALRDSFERAVDADPQLVAHFYEALFTQEPSLRAYFPRSMGGQESALAAKLIEVMLHLEDAEWLAAHLPALGRRHAEQYRARREHFPLVTGVLIDTLEAAVGGWGDEHDHLRTEWTAALGAVTALMLAGFPAE